MTKSNRAMVKAAHARRDLCSNRAANPVFRLKPLLWLIRQAFVVTAIYTQIPGGALAAGPVPGVRIPSSALPSGPANQGLVGNIGGRAVYSPQVVTGQFNPYQVTTNSDGSVTATISQKDNAGILQWNRFDIGANATVNVEQPSGTSVLLNKVSDGDWNHSTLIEGKLNANGQVYIYNPNGIIFGKSSLVNVNSLVASTLKIDNARFMAGILAPSIQPILAVDASAGPIGSVVVEGERDAGGNLVQAQIHSANGGRILLAGPSVSNSGLLSSPNGQVVLAAGGRVFLTSPTNVMMRGLVVEVDNSNLAVADRGGATNEAIGQIKVGHGNATMVGLAVNQMGTVSASTSVSANGSIYLHARDGSSITATNTATSTNGGALVLGSGSVTEILPDFSDTTTSSGSNFNSSLVDLSGKTIHLQQNAAIVAPGGVVDAKAYAKPGQGGSANQGGSSHIYLDSGAVIDVSGTTESQLAMESNVIQVQLRGTELADSPFIRNNPAIRGKTVSVDIRKGTPLANIQGWLDLVEYGIGQRTAAGGSINFQSESDIVVTPGARLNVSGGLVTYKSGYITTSKLTSNGSLFDIGVATADRSYDGIVTPFANPRNFAAGYVQGYSAGSITLNAPALVVQGDLEGKVTTGPLQRTVGAANVPQGGLLVIGNSDTGGDTSKIHFAGSAYLNGSQTQASILPVFDDTHPASALQLPVAMLNDADIPASSLAQNGFSRFRVYADEGSVTVAKPLALAPGGELTATAKYGIEIAGNITSLGGKVSATSGSSLKVDDGVAIDVSGRWTNDQVNAGLVQDAQGNPVTPIILQGGSINLVAANSTPTSVVIGDHVTLDVSGGAWRNQQGKQTAGSAGSIVLGPSVSGSSDPSIQSLSLGHDLVLKGYGLAAGGSLQVSAPNVLLGANSTDASILGLNSSWFQSGGFSSFDIRAGGNLTLASGATIAPRSDNWQGKRDTATVASGLMTDAFDVATLPLSGVAGTRKAASISLRAADEQLVGQGVLQIKEGAAIVTDPGGAITLSAGTQLTVDGALSAKGGAINLYLTPSMTSSPPYLPERSIWLGSHSVLDVSGSAGLLWRNSLGVTQGRLLDGGQIRIGYLTTDKQLSAAPGYVIVNPGAYLDVSGTTASLSQSAGRSGLQTSTVASNGGSIDIHAREGLLFEGRISAAGGSDSAHGGSLALVLDRDSLAAIPAGYPTDPLNFVVAVRDPLPGSSGRGVIPQGLQPGQPIHGLSGQGFVAAETLNAGKFDSVRIKSAGAIDFDLAGGSLTLAAQSGLTVDAPTFVASNAGSANVVNLNAPYVQVGNSDWRYQSDASPAIGGLAKLQVNAGTADLIGKSSLSGFGEALFNVRNDVRLLGQVDTDLSADAAAVPLPVHAFGRFNVAGRMEFVSAQVYPTSLSEFSLNASGSNSRVTFASNGNAAAVPLSAAGSLTVAAKDIEQNGFVRAPLGSLDFEATNSLTYGAGSTTSVAGATTVPLGFVQNGRDWLYDFGNGHTINLSDSGATNYRSLPAKEIVSRAGAVNVNPNARLDLSGGGDLYAYEFTPGPGGSSDVLAKANTYAILPGYTGQIAPSDFQFGNAGLNAGDRIYLSGIPGLPAGYYTLLPAHYALLPGAYAVSKVAGNGVTSVTQSYRTPLGSWLVSGYRTSLGGGADSVWQGFQLTPAALVRQQSEFTDHGANSFLASSGLALPGDGGQAVFDVSQSLVLNGFMNLSAAPGGQRGVVDISAPAIIVVSDVSQPSPAEAESNAVRLLASDLNALGAESLLLGGVRSQTSTGRTITVGAGQVVVANDIDHALKGPEILLVAGSQETFDAATGTVSPVQGSAGLGEVLVKTGSSIVAEGGTSHSSLAIALVNKSNPDALGADGALLRVATGAPISLSRELVRADGKVVAPSGQAGTVHVETGVNISTNGSLMFDATHTTRIDSNPHLASGAALQLGANRISLGTSAPTAVPGLRFDDTALANLSHLSALSLTSYSAIDIYGSVALGGAAMQTLAIKASGIQSHGSGIDDSVFSAAQSIHFEGNGIAAGDAQTSATGGRLAFNTKNIEIGNAPFAVRGFSQTALNATNDVVATGNNGAFSSDANLTITSARITAGNGKDAGITAGNTLNLVQGAAADGGLPASQLGGHLAFSGRSIVSNATVEAKSGRIDFNAANGVDISGGMISVAGGAETFGSTVAYSPGGTISMNGGSGNVLVESAATLDVSSVGASAGLLSVKATNSGGNGKVILDGTLKGEAVAGLDGVLPAQGRFVVDADQQGPLGFGALNGKLDQAGFTESRAFRLRNDSVRLAAGEKITAHEVSVSVDNGNIDIAGTIIADGSKGGKIELYAAEASAGGGKGNVTLERSAILSAKALSAATSAAGSNGDGGRIVIGTATLDGGQSAALGHDATITINAGAQLDVSGSGLGQGGAVLLRAPRLIGNDDVAVAGFDTAAVKGSRSLAIEAYKVYQASGISENADSATNLQVADSSGAPAGVMYSDALGFNANQSNILSRFANASAMTILPGLEVRSAGDLTVSVNENSGSPESRGWNLNAWQLPGVLTLRAAGNLIIKGSISDGFTQAAGVAMPDWTLDPNAAPSWSYRLVGGAGRGANPLETSASTASGDMILSFARTTSGATDYPVALIRTGTGFIDVAAGRDVVLDTLDLNRGALFSDARAQGRDFYSSVSFQNDTLLGASIYTAGHVASQSPTTPPKDASNAVYGSSAVSPAQFTEDGGAISVYGERNVIGPVTSQLVTNWLFRQGRTTVDSSGNTIFANAPAGRRGSGGPSQFTAWWSRFDYFDEGIATFGGGDLTVRAKTGDVVDLSASIATNAFYRTVGGAITENGGGDLVVSAGGDIRGGAYYVQKGSAELSAQGSIMAGNAKVFDSSSASTTPIPLHTVLAAGDSQFNLVAGKDLQLEGIFNPTLVTQSVYNVPGVNSGNFTPGSSTVTDQFSLYSTYSADSALRATALSGNVLLSENAYAMAAAAGPDVNQAWSRTADYLRLYLVTPATMQIAALGGDLSFEHGFAMAPSGNGDLSLLAKGSVTADYQKNSSGALTGVVQPVVMIDRNPSAFLSVDAPHVLTATDIKTIEGAVDATGIDYHMNGNLHAGDSKPVRIVALDGDVSFKANNSHAATLIVPKAAEIIAGRDIIDVGFSIQQLAASDISIVTAGRDIVDTTSPEGTNAVAHVVTGPGRVDFNAGRNFDLGNGNGVVTRGNLDNPYLPRQGADINVVAGASADYANLAAQYLSPAKLSATEQTALLAYMRRISPDFPATATLDEAWAAFNGLSLSLRRPFLDTLFFDALRQASGAVGGGALDLAKFDAVIASLFPVEAIHGGDVNVFGSQLKTARGGAINIYTPGGSVYAGLVNTPAYLKTKADSDKGIFTIDGGAIQSLVKNDFLVNQGRVFTLGGGDITLVSQYGNIDAGKGAKTSQSAPPPVLTTDKDGNTQVDISGSISGSGIATLRTNSEVPASDVYPIAPRGIFDAGDAGLRSTGSVNIVAAQVLNAGNIAASGSVSGVKTIDSSGLGAAISTPAAPPASKTDDLAKTAAADPNAASSLTVELLGYGVGTADGGVSATTDRGVQQTVTQAGQTSLSAKDDDERKKKISK